MTQYERTRDFITVYMRSDTIAGAAETLGVKSSAVHARAGYLRKKGINLPKMGATSSRSLSSLEIAQLNSYIKKLKRGE